MTKIYSYKNKILSQNNKIAISKNCCCECECLCGSVFPQSPLTLANVSNRLQIKITLGNFNPPVTHIYCLHEFPKPQTNGIPGVGYVERLTCNSQCNYELLFNSGTCNHTIVFKLTNFPDCECDTTDYCDLEVVEWSSEEGCPIGGSVTDVEILGFC